MDEGRLRGYLARFPDARVLVVGDYFLDRYWALDRALGEVSLETGLEAYQVTDVRCSPGAAGNVAANLAALGAQVTALSVLGDDGEAFELRRELGRRGIDAQPMLTLAERFTPTYAKPMMREADGRVHELNRLDTKNRVPLPAEAEAAIIERLRALAPNMDAVVVADQVQERNCGVVTDRVRQAIGALGRSRPELVVAVDSRERIGEYAHVIIKPNRREAARAIAPGWSGAEEDLTEGHVIPYGEALQYRMGRPVFLTLSERGILCFTEEGHRRVSAVPVTGEIDPVGAGDSTMAGIVLALSAGSTTEEAALVGNLTASVTIQQLGTTGTASPRQVLEAFRQMVGAGP